MTENNRKCAGKKFVLLKFQATKDGVDLLEIEPIRIKWLAEPVKHLLVRFVLRIVQGLQQFVVAPDAAAVFRRTGLLTGQANRTLLFKASEHDFFDHHAMFPAIAEVVFVKKGRLFMSREVRQAKTPLVQSLYAGVVIL